MRTMWMLLLAVGGVAHLGCDDESTHKDPNAGSGGAADGSASGGSSGSSGGGGASGSGGQTQCTPCTPDSALFIEATSTVSNAGVSIALDPRSCGATQGPPPGDELVLDFDLNSMAFLGSGSGFSVVSLSAGNFANQADYYSLDSLPALQTIVLVLEQNGTGIRVAVSFRLNNTAAPSVEQVCVTF